MSILKLVPKKKLSDFYYDVVWSDNHVVINSYTMIKRDEHICIKRTRLLIIEEGIGNISFSVGKIRAAKFFFEILVRRENVSMTYELKSLKEIHCLDDVTELDSDVFSLKRNDDSFAQKVSDYIIECLHKGSTLIYAPKSWFLEISERKATIKELLLKVIGENI